MNIINIDDLDQIIIGRVDPYIYAFTTGTVPNYLKVGDTYRPVEIRLNEWRKHFPNLIKKYYTIAKVDKDIFFRDYAVHYFLENDLRKVRLQPGDIKNISHYSNEFFKNTSEKDIQDAINDVIKSHKKNDLKYQYYRFEDSRIPVKKEYSRSEKYSPRPNQLETINNFKKAINNGRKNLLMYAVMRFGKSFTSMCCALEMNAKIVIVVSAKADVKNEWKKTTESHIKFSQYCFLDSNSLIESETIFEDKKKKNINIVLFLTLQDLQGDVIKPKHKKIFQNQVDLLLIDESHFGARSTEYGKVLQENNLNSSEIKNELKLNDNTLDEIDETIKSINAKIRIHLSGTPYRILMNSEFSKEDIIAFYQFTDIVEDQQKWDLDYLKLDNTKEWDNPYYGFPQMIRFAFNPNESSRKRLDELKSNGFTHSFSELFKPMSLKLDKTKKLHKKFKYENEIIDLLKVIDGSKNDTNILSFLDYNKIQEGNMCRHIVCVLPYRASCDAFETLINKYNFKHLNNYEILNISGVDNEKKYKDIESIKSKITYCENEGKKTITLTVNRMLTGTTVSEWDTMLYFKDTASPQEYDQAIFRLQNQFVKTYKDPKGDIIKYNMKPQTILVDFNPNRMFHMQENKSLIYNVNTESNGNSKLENRIKNELKISPIIVLNNKKIHQVEPSDILDSIRKYSSNKSVFDEATTISIDYSLLEIDEIKKEIEKQEVIGSRNGLTIKASKGEGEDLDLDIGIDVEGQDITEKNNNNIDQSNDTNESIEDFKGKFAMYYARILFFAFLSDTKVKSLNDILLSVKQNLNEKRIFSNLDLNLKILELFQKYLNPFILIELDNKIHNINTLSNDKSIIPIERASNAFKRFGRLSDAEVVTPEIVTNKIVDAIPFKSINKKSKFIDIASKQGEFVYAIFKKYGKSIAQNFYSIPTSKIAYEFTRKVYNLLELDIMLIEKNYTSYILIENLSSNKAPTLKINNNIMNFNVIVGNPPYQQSDTGANQNSASPIYNKFVEIAKKLNPEYISMIIPTRWYAGGKDLDSFRDQMLNDIHISELHDFLKPDIIFPNINLRGGICYFLMDRSYNNQKKLTKLFTYYDSLDPTLHIRSLKTEGSDILIRHSIAVEILEKIKSSKDFISFESHVSGRKPFGFDSNIIKNPKIFRTTKKGLKEPIICFGKGKKVGYVNRNEIIKNPHLIDKYKVFTPRANNIGTELNDDNLNTFIGSPNTICTEAYIVVGSDLNLNASSAKNLCKYFTTKFARFQHGVGKASQDATSKTYKFLPLQNFTLKSDINWSKPVTEIDKFLYKKYKLTNDQIQFIDTMIKSMD